MIPRILERMIFEGRAQFKTWCVGGAAVSRIPVTKGHYIVVTGFDYHPFIDAPLPSTVNQWQNQAFRMCTQHQVILYTTKNKFQWNFRDWYSLSQDTVSGVANLMTTPGAPHSQSCYCVFGENVRVNIRPVGGTPDQWNVLQLAQMPDSSDELPGPLFAGTVATGGINSLLEFEFQPNDTDYLPNNDQVPPTANVDTNPQFQSKVGELANPAGIVAVEQSGMNYPLLNFRFVEVFEPLPESLKGR